MDTSTVLSPDELVKLMGIIDGWKAIQLTDYMQTADLTLIIVDYFQTLPDEIQLMWPSKGFSLPKFLFFALRYGIFAERMMDAYYMRLKWATPRQCHRAFTSVCISSGLILLASEVVLFVRVYAFAGRTRRMLTYIILQFVVLAVSLFALLSLFARSVVYVELPIPICMPVELSPKLLGAVYTVAFSNMLAVMLIMVYIGRRQHQGLNSTLFAVFYRDGLSYFVCLSAFAIFNGIMGFIAPVRYKFLFIQMETDLHAVLATRMLLHLRAQSRRGYILRGDDSADDACYLSGVTTAPPPLQFARNDETVDSTLATVCTA